jgi:acetophenone carboxylase
MAKGIDFEIANSIYPRSFSKEEIEDIMSLDDLDFDIYRHRLFQIADEGKQAMEKLANSPIVRDCGEIMYGIYTSEGETVLSSTGILLHVASLGLAIKYVLKHYQDDLSVGVRPGDQFFNSHPWYGGTHNPDQGLLKPVFYEGKIIAWVACLTHTPPVGAIDPGGMPARATTKFEEGLRVPAVKIAENDRLKSDLENWLADGSDSPDHLLLDLRAKMAGTYRGNMRMLELAEQYGADFLLKAHRRCIFETMEHCRKKIRAVNNGVYRQRHFYDNIGSGMRGLWKVNLDLIVEDDKLIFDFNNSSPQSPGPFNMSPSALMGGIMAGLCTGFFWDVTWNDGIMGVLEVRIPEVGTSIVNAFPEAAINHGVLLNEAVGDMIRLATSKFMYDSPFREDVNASWCAAGGCPFYGGLNQWGLPLSSQDLSAMASGTGARSDGDGVDTGGMGWAPDSSGADVESWEHEAPLMALVRNHMIDSGGAGKYRGGASLMYAHVVKNTPIALFLGGGGMSDRFHPSFGLFGGYAASSIQPLLILGTNFEELVNASGKRDLPFYDMDRFSQEVKGKVILMAPSYPPEPVNDGDIGVWPMSRGSAGGGYGDVLQRDPEMVMEDIRNRIVSHWVVRNVYHVVYDQDTLRVDYDATEAERAEVRKERLEKGVSFEEFEKIRRAKKPKDEILQHFGPWPGEQGGTNDA